MVKFAVLLLAGVLIAAASAPNVSRAHANAFQAKVQRIVQQGAVQNKTGKPRSTTVSEAEVNSYLAFSAGDQLPVGVTQPTLVIQPQGRVSGRAIVDLDQVRQKKGTGGWFDLTSYLTGKLPVTASGVLRAENRAARFELQSAEVSGIPIPKAFLQELVSYYTKSTDYPNGIGLDQTFALPANIQRISTDTGRATVVQ